MDERAMLLRKYSAEQFAAFEIHIFLDTHPNDQAALTRYKMHVNNAEKLKREFESKYGPLTADAGASLKRWEWINNPWPWEKEDND